MSKRADRKEYFQEREQFFDSLSDSDRQELRERRDRLGDHVFNWFPMPSKEIPPWEQICGGPQNLNWQFDSSVRMDDTN